MALFDEIRQSFFQRKTEREIKKMQSKIQKLYGKAINHVTDEDIASWNSIDTTDDSTADEFKKLEEMVKAMKKIEQDELG